MEDARALLDRLENNGKSHQESRKKPFIPQKL